MRPWIAVLLAGLAIPAEAGRTRLPANLPFGNFDERQVVFPEDFSFPFGGVRYKSCFITANGLLCFQYTSTSAPSATSPPALLIAEMPRIAPLWVDLDPSLGGRVTAGRISATEFEFRWSNVPAAGNPANLNTVSCILRTDGTFDFVYGNLNPTPQSAQAAAFVGFSTGNANTAGIGTVTNFTMAPQCPALIGTGTEAAMYQFFSPASGAGALANRCLRFAPALPASGRLTLFDDDDVEVALPGWTFPFHGNRYTSFHVHSNGSVNFAYSDFTYGPFPADFLGHGGGLSVAWSDLQPDLNGRAGSAGTIAVSQTSTSTTVAWTNVPYYGVTGSTSTFSVTFNSDGTFSYNYGVISNTPPTTATNIVVGQTGGYPVTTGTELAAPLPTSPINTAPVAVFDYPLITSFPYTGTIHWNANHTANSSPIPLGDDDSYEYLLPSGTIQFAGGKYASVFVRSDGYLSLGGADIDIIESTPEHLSLFPRICGAWDDLTAAAFGPSYTPEGSISVTSTPSSVTATYNVFETGQSVLNTFSITLSFNGSFSLTYGAMGVRDCLVGYSAGGDKTTGAETSSNLSSQMSWGTGTERAVFEQFTIASTFDLANTTRTFAGAGPILYQAAPASPSVVPVCLGGGLPDANKLYVLAMSLGSVPGLPLGACGTIPLNLDPLMVLILQLSGAGIITPGISGPLDGFGQIEGWPATNNSPLAVVVPSGLGGSAITVYLAFVTLPGGGGCPFSTISPAAPFTIP
jgi:hypothetical protein